LTPFRRDRAAEIISEEWTIRLEDRRFKPMKTNRTVAAKLASCRRPKRLQVRVRLLLLLVLLALNSGCLSPSYEENARNAQWGFGRDRSTLVIIPGVVEIPESR
jgi:hypothetical protein